MKKPHIYLFDGWWIVSLPEPGPDQWWLTLADAFKQAKGWYDKMSKPTK